MLNDIAIKEELKKGNIFVDKAEENIGNNFIEVHLGDSLKVYDVPILDVTESSPTKQITIEKEGFILKPNELYLGRTIEFTKTYGFVPLLTSYEELAAVGMEIHVTAGFGDNGFEGTWTLEIVCANQTIVYPGMPIGRIYYLPLIGDSKITYRGKYFRQEEVTESRLSQEYILTRTKENKYVNKQ